MAELTNESAQKANNLPMLSEMLTKFEGKAPFTMPQNRNYKLTSQVSSFVESTL
jgi:hypothetical protein